jgi:molybdopterin molybdotransferase
MTGGTVPDEADCVVKVEDCEEVEDRVSPRVSLEPGALINEPGSEAPAGWGILDSGRRLDDSCYPVLFCAGISQVEAYRRPSVGILITGDELREVEDGPEVGQEFNTNRYILESFFEAIGIPCARQQWVPDEQDATREALNELSECCDFIVSSGAVSMGRYDYIKRVFRDSDYSLIVERTAIKPGSPLMVAQRAGKLFFGMPGYPAAFLTNALLYLVPALKKASGRGDFEHRRFNAVLRTALHARRGRLDAARAHLEIQDGRWTASDPGSQRTSQFLNFTDVNGLALVPASEGAQPAGSTVEVLSFDLELT